MASHCQRQVLRPLSNPGGGHRATPWKAADCGAIPRGSTEHQRPAQGAHTAHTICLVLLLWKWNWWISHFSGP